MNTPGARRNPRAEDALSRGVLGLFGLLALLAVAAALLGRPGLELVWIDLRRVPEGLRYAALGGCGVLWIGWAQRPASGWRRAWTLAAAWSCAAVMAFNACVVAGLWLSGAVGTRMPLPLSGLFAAAMGWVAWRIGRDAGTVRASRSAAWLTASAAGLVFPLLQVFTLGHSDYRRPAGVAVVPGARVYADGTLSEAVGDRVRTAAGLYRDGLVRGLVMSGGPGDGPVHEVEAMREAAVRLGVRREHIELDYGGLNTRATANNTRSWVKPGERPLVVSEFYHLPRIRLAYAAVGVEALTVPAVPRHAARWFPLRSLAREVPAWWLYYFRSALG